MQGQSFLKLLKIIISVRVLVFNATHSNTSVISWRSDLLVEDTRVPGENLRPDKLYHIMLYRVPERDSNSQR